MPDSDEKIRKKRYEELEQLHEERLRDAVTGYRFRKSQMQDCPHPAIRKRYAGATGACWVSVWTCRKCRHVITFPFHGGVKCGYKEN